MMMYQQLLRIWYVSPYGLGLVCFVVAAGLSREAAFFNYQIAHGLAPPLSHPDFLAVVSMSVLCLFSFKHNATPLLLCVHAVSVLLKT